MTYIKSKYKCKLCKLFLIESKFYYFQYNCKSCDKYIFDNLFINKNDPSKYELYIIDNNRVIVDYIKNQVKINHEIISYIKLNDYKLDDIENTLSLQSIYDILEKYYKYKNIL